METTNKKKKGMIKLIAFILMVLLIVALNHYYGRTSFPGMTGTETCSRW